MKKNGHWYAVVLPLIAIAGIIGYVAYRTRRVPTPKSRWKRFFVGDAFWLDAFFCNALQGIYRVEEGRDFFGKTAVLKWTYTIEEKKTIYHLSFFCEKSGTYVLARGKQQGNDILLNGHWRKAAANGTGLVHLVLKNGVALLQNISQTKYFTFHGLYGNGNNAPNKTVSFRFQTPLPQVRPFDIIAHRGGSRNVDFLPVSENTLQMTKMAARLGANGIEIDVRMTKDGVPVIFHDSFFSIHTIKHKIYGGFLHNYTFDELQRIELRKGGHIPTLAEMLNTVLYQTPLEVVWLDIKKECDFHTVRNLQRHYHQLAAEIGRDLRIYIGIPDKVVLKCFQGIEDYHQVPSLTELDCELAISINAEVWAPQYTRGFQSDDVAKIHAAGKKAYVWSLDAKWMVDMYINEGSFDGLVTNAAPVVAHWLYTQAVAEHEKVG